MDKKLILLIDDEESILLLLKRRLEKAGFSVETSKNGQDGLNKARTIKPDLIILDIMLPIMDGYKICQMLKFDENYKKIPIILLSARNQEEDRAIGLQTGADFYLAKSSATDFWQDLLAKITQLLEG
jgi:DNA-binding response OmpR family regulator